MKKYTKRERISITKYDPKFRNELGHYKKDEWTSISDLGTVYDGNIFTYEEYLRIETQYVTAVLLSLDFFKSKSVKITHLYKLNISKNNKFDNAFLHNQLNCFYLNDKIKNQFAIEILLKLRLREYIGELDLLIDGKSKTEILFGFDYYMYLKAHKEILTELVPLIETTGLFVW